MAKVAGVIAIDDAVANRVLRRRRERRALVRLFAQRDREVVAAQLMRASVSEIGDRRDAARPELDTQQAVGERLRAGDLGAQGERERERAKRHVRCETLTRRNAQRQSAAAWQ